MPSYENDPSIREVAFSALTARSAWFEDLRMRDAEKVVTQFLLDWRAAQYRHDADGQTIVKWAVSWSDQNRAKYEEKFPYLAPVRAGE